MAERIDYRPEHRRKILEFFADVPFKEQIWRWEFEESPGAKKRGFKPVLMADEQGVVGFNGVMPVSVTFENETVDALWSCDFHVAARARGQGLGQGIKRHLMGAAPVIMSFGVSEQAAIVLRKMGWRPSQEVQSFRKIVRARSLKELALKCIQLGNRLLSGINESYSGTITASDSLPAQQEVDDLWAQCASSYRKVVNRHYDYLDWRYQQHPLASYRFLVARSPGGQLDGMLVVRENRGVARIVDYVGRADDVGLMRSLVQEVAAEFPHARLHVTTASGESMQAALKREGYCLTRSRPALYVRSELENVAEPEKGWFVMAGDSDGELLAASYDAMKGGKHQREMIRG